MPPNPLQLKLAPSGAFFAFLVTLLALAIELPGHWVLTLVCAAMAAGFVYWYCYHVDDARNRWQPTLEQLDVQVEHSEVNPDSVNRVRRILMDDENAIRWISHQHVIQLWLRIGWLLLLAAAWLGVVIAIGTIHLSSDGARSSVARITHSSTIKASPPKQKPDNRLPNIKPATRFPVKIHLPKSITLRWWLLTLPSVLLILVAMWRWAKWSSWFFIVTNRRVIVLERPLSILPFMAGEDEPFYLSDIKNAEIKGSAFRRRWGLAVMDVSTLMQSEEDAAIKGIFGLPHADYVSNLINTLAAENQVSVVDESTGVFRELSEEIRRLNKNVERGLLERRPDEWPTSET